MSICFFGGCCQDVSVGDRDLLWLGWRKLSQPWCIGSRRIIQIESVANAQILAPDGIDVPVGQFSA